MLTFPYLLFLDQIMWCNYSYLSASIPRRIAMKQLHSSYYSYRRASTGFFVAACQLFSVTVNITTANIEVPETINSQMLRSVLYEKL